MIKNIIVIIFILVVHIGFAQDLSKTSQTQDYYNTKSVKEIHDLGTFSIKIQKNKIYFNSRHGNLNSALSYNNLYSEFNFNNIYQIRDSQNNRYFFRFGWVSFNNDETIFSNIQWIGKPILKLDAFTDLEFTIVDIEYIQFGDFALCTIGDSQTWWSSAQQLRKEINENFENAIFIGSNTDIFGYRHEGEGGNSTEQLLKRVNHIPKADFYTLMIGTNDWEKDMDTAFSNILKVIDHLIKLNPDSKIIYLTPLPTTNTARDTFNKKLCDKLMLRLKTYNQIVILDIGKRMRENKNWKDAYLSGDGLHQNKNGVELMGKLIGEKLRSLVGYQHD